MKLILPVVLAAFTSSSIHSQQPPVKTATAGVLIDVSVVDKKGQPVLDLTPADFELSEEGKRQQLRSVTLVHGGVMKPVGRSLPTRTDAAAPAAAELPAEAAPAPALDNTPTITAILFDKLSPDAMPYAARAALTSVSTLVPPRDHAGIFLADVSLRTFEPFTSDRGRLGKAIEQIAGTATLNVREETRRAGDLFLQKLDPNTSPTAGAESTGGTASLAERERIIASMDLVQKRMFNIMWRMEMGFRQMLAEYDGQTSITALRAVVDGLALAPGRKSILYFTENLVVTDRLKTRFEAIIGYANRANITFYPVDAAGLRTQSKEAEVARNVNLAGAQGIGDAEREQGAWTKELERQNQLVESRPTAILSRLAKDTGGFLIENTNNLAAGVARMQKERTTYYLLGYQPTNATMDGKFRRVSVKVKRSKVSVRARPGYIAVAQEPR
jgi:VWFA-related protein